MRLRRLSICLGVSALALASLAASPARADGLALNRFEVAPAGDRMFGVPSPYAAGGDAPTLHLMLLGDWAHDPLLIRDSTGAEIPGGAVVGNQFFTNLNATIAIFHRLSFNLNIPVAFAQDGEDPVSGGTLFRSPSGVEFGDVRLGLRVNVLGGYRDPFQIGVAGTVWLPTSSPGSYVSDGQVRGMPQLILGGRIDRGVWSFAAGPEFRKQQTFNGIEQGTMLRMGAGVGVLLGDKRQLQIGPEMSASLVVADINKQNTNVEALLDARYRFADDFEAGLGFGPGITTGVGTPLFRGVFMVAYTPEQKPPPGDRDHDGFLDPVDACPDVPGVQSFDPKKNGCPRSDRDKDGVFDEDDACPDLKGIKTKNPATNGCPGDSDKDGIRDDKDACPFEKGKADPDPLKNGCPRAVRVTMKEIQILEEIQFAFDKFSISPRSSALLDEVAEVMGDHPEITRIEIEGHADSVGTVAYNKTLSQKRAEAVRKALIDRGVAADRLTAKGYGKDAPIADNDTAEGRRLNRRTPFTILERKAPDPQ